MSRRLTLILTACSLIVPGLLEPSEASATELSREQVIGNDRICVYEKEGVLNREQVATRVGIGQPCPHTLPEPEKAEIAIPFMAQLSSQRIRNGVRTCIYQYESVLYERSVPLNSRCPMSPYF